MQRTGDHGGLARQVVLLASALGLWVAFVLLFAAPLALTHRVSWQEAVSFGASFWASWLLFLPAVAWMSFRFPIERRTLLRTLALHGACCLLIVGTTRASFRAVARNFPFPQRSENSGGPPGLPADAHQAPESAGTLAVPGPPPRRPLDLVGPPHSHGVFLGLRAALDVLVYGALVGVCQAITNYRDSQRRERRAAELETRLTRAKLQALRMQIHPHFLFNTLNSITALVYLNPRAADEMLGDLSDLLRRSLDSMEEQEVPLARELDFIRGYLRIETQRLGDRLRVEESIPAELRQALVPTLILQPLVENAIRHGIEPRRGPGLVVIKAARDGNQLHLVVRDDGRGLPSPGHTPTEHPGIGLANSRARLQELYGPNQGLTLASADPQGCQVDVRLPFHLTPWTDPSASNASAA